MPDAWEKAAHEGALLRGLRRVWRPRIRALPAAEVVQHRAAYAAHGQALQGTHGGQPETSCLCECADGGPGGVSSRLQQRWRCAALAATHQAAAPSHMSLSSHADIVSCRPTSAASDTGCSARRAGGAACPGCACDAHDRWGARLLVQELQEALLHALVPGGEQVGHDQGGLLQGEQAGRQAQRQGLVLQPVVRLYARLRNPGW